MSKPNMGGGFPPNRHSGVGQDHRRVASRMEGVVKNAGNRAQKKPKQGK
jgi:hypothetical protein